jgi:hypothetical protein
LDRRECRKCFGSGQAPNWAIDPLIITIIRRKLKSKGNIFLFLYYIYEKKIDKCVIFVAIPPIL